MDSDNDHNILKDEQNESEITDSDLSDHDHGDELFIIARGVVGCQAAIRKMDIAGRHYTPN